MKQVLSVVAFIFFLWILMIASCRRDKPLSSNFSPIAKAGFDQAITLPTDSTFLDGTASGDRDGTISEWLWTIISGPTSITIVNETLAKTVVKNLTAGVYKFELKVTDDGGAVGRDTIQVSVIQPNRPPIAKAGADVSITLTSCASPGFAQLNGSSSSDPDNGVLNYLWTKISGPSTFTLINRTTALAVIQNLLGGVYGLELHVIDPQGLSSRDTVLVNVIRATPVEFNLDISLNGHFNFVNNYEDCYYYSSSCSYYDLTTIEVERISSTIGELDFYAYESADSAFSSDPTESWMNLWNNNDEYIYGSSNINFKKLIQKGGGSFAGSLSVKNGSASECDPEIFKNLSPLTVTGSMDTTTRTINLNIKGKIYF